MSKREWIVAGMVVCLAAMPVPAVGQQQVGGLRVVLIDPSGGLIPGAEVEFRGSALIRPVFGLSDDRGLIVNSSLPPGIYTLTARCPGFRTAVKEEVMVQVGRSYSVEMALEVGRVESTIVVEAGGAAIDTFKSEAASVYTGEGLTNAAGGRDFTDYARFAPSVNIEALSGNVAYRGQSVQGISVDGSSGAENVFYVDGVDTTSMYNGLNNQKLRVETVEEFQLKTAGYEAEFGGAMGGVLSARTRSGSNEFHGSLLWYGSGSALAGRPRKRLRLDPTQSVDVAEYVFDPEDGDATHELGFTLGGPLWRDRVWFFGGFLSEARNRNRSVTFTSGEAGRYQRKDRMRSIPVKIDFQPAEKVRFMASAVADRFQLEGRTAPSRRDFQPGFRMGQGGLRIPRLHPHGSRRDHLQPVRGGGCPLGVERDPDRAAPRPQPRSVTAFNRVARSDRVRGRMTPLYRPRGFLRDRDMPRA